MLPTFSMICRCFPLTILVDTLFPKPATILMMMMEVWSITNVRSPVCEPANLVTPASTSATNPAHPVWPKWSKLSRALTSRQSCAAGTLTKSATAQQWSSRYFFLFFVQNCSNTITFPNFTGILNF